MKTYKQVKREYVEDVHDKTLCDKCDEPIETARYELFEAELLIKQGTSFPDDGEVGERWDMQLCQTCTEGLLDLLKSKGYRVIFSLFCP